MAFTFSVSILSARMLGAHQFGELGLLLSTSAAYAILAGAWLSVLATKLVSECAAQTPHALGSIVSVLMRSTLSLTVPLTILLFAVAGTVAEHLIQAPQLTGLLKLIAILQALNALDTVQSGIIAGMENYRAAVVSNLVRGLVSLPLTLFAIHLGQLEGAIMANVAVNMLAIALNHRLIRQALTKRETAIRHDIPLASFARQHGHLAIPSLLGALLGAPALWALNTSLSQQPNGYVQVGLFAAANQWKNAILFLPRRLSSASLPIMGHLPDGASRLFSITQSLAVLVCLPVVGVLYFLSDWIASFYGQDFREAGAVFIGVMLVAGLNSVGAGVAAAIVSKGRMWLGLFTNIVTTALLVGVGLALIPRFGAEGIFWAMSLSSTVGLFLTYLLMLRDFKAGTLLRATGAICLLFAFAWVARTFPQAPVLGATLAGTLMLLVAYGLLIDPSLKQAIRRFIDVQRGNVTA